MNAQAPTNPSKLILIVLYRTEIGEADTVQSILRCNKCLDRTDKILVWDNSREPQPEQAVANIKQVVSCDFEYCHTPENLSLAKIYNTARRQNAHYDLMVLFDQDSLFREDYFVQLGLAVTAQPDIDVFVPLIRSGGAIVSPGHFFYFKGSYWREPKFGVLPVKNNVAITSGMAIRMQYLNGWSGFDERLQLYGIDTNFMLRYAKDKPFFFVMDVYFEHQLSDFDLTERRAAKQGRFEDFKRASLINAQLFSLPVRILTRLFLLYKTIRF